MRMTEVSFGRQPPIDGYGRGGFRIGGLTHLGGLMILPGRIDDWRPASPPRTEDFAAAIAAGDQFDLLLVGTGSEIAPLGVEVLAALETAGIAVEALATPAACRTYNVLLAESRRVAAALVPVV